MKLAERLVQVKKWFLEKKILKHLFLFTILQFSVAYTLMALEVPKIIEPCKEDELQLASIAEPFIPLYFVIIVLVLGITIEEIVLRFLPLWLLKKNIQTKVRLIVPLFIIFSAIIHTLCHQGNVLGGTLSGRLRYLGIHTTSGFYFAWLFVRKGFWATWFIHTIFDLFVVGISLTLNV